MLSDHSDIMPEDGSALPYAADLDIIRLCAEKRWPVSSHPFFRDMEKHWPFVVCELKDATVLGDIQIPIVDGQPLYDCLTFYGPKHYTELTRKSGSGERRVFNVEEAFLLGGDSSIGLAMCSTLMRTLYLQLFEHLKHVPVITMKGMAASMYELFALFGCPADRLIQLDSDEAVRCRRLFVPTVTGGVSPIANTWSIPAKITRVFRDLVVGAHAVAPPPAPDKCVYILRRNTTKKLIDNDRDVIAFMESRGYAVVDPAELSIQEQVRLAQQANYFVTCEGSQMHLADFAQPGAKVLMICMEQLFQQRAGTAMTRWDDIGIDVIPFFNPVDENNAIRVDIGALESAMRTSGFPLAV